jgi:predicted regulator of Ras-like GTPase activity (Roadblock/LC7/MglB family)
MTIPFVNLFNKLRARLLMPAVEAVTKPVHRFGRPKKPDDQHFHKTVLPNSTRSFAPPDPLQAASGAAAGGKISGQLSPTGVLAPIGPTISRASGLPRALAMALEPSVERVIKLRLSDFVDQVPPEYIKPVEVIDTGRAVALKASEVEKGMAERKPSISLTSLYQQVPDIFLRSVSPTETKRILLPYAKVLEQFSNARVRSDQERDQRVPQVDTPILQATMKDTERFGTKIEPLESSDLPPVTVKPPCAEAFASAEPEPAVTEKMPSMDPGTKPLYPVISLRSNQPERKTEPTPSPETAPCDLPPNGTGEPASQGVPASSGPPVPNAPESPQPTSIPFKISLEDFGPEFAHTALPASEPPAADEGGWISKETYTGLEAETIAEEKEQGRIALKLKPVLENVPAFQLNGDVGAVAEEEQIEFPLTLVKSQLASGRVSVAAKLFKETLPEEYRDLFVIDPEETAVSLPLQEVLKNLPDDALEIRADQEKETQPTDIETPFSKRAQEDAERLDGAVAVPESAEEPAPEPPGAIQPELPAMEKIESVAPNRPGPPAQQQQTEPPPPAETESPAAVQPELPVQVAPQAKKESDVAERKVIDGRQVVAEACRVPGVSACEITFPDGLSLAGNFPPETGAEGLCAMAPMVLQRVGQHMAESKLGLLTAMTLHSTSSSITFFMKENICLAALHQDQGGLTPEACTELEQLTEKLSQAYTQPERPHVDH